MKFSREPALWINVVAAVLGLIVTFGMSWLDVSDATNIVAALTAATGAITAIKTRPWSVSIFTGVISTTAVLLAGYGLDFSQEQVGSVQLIAATILTLIARGQIEPAPTVLPTERHRL
jgi:hypothetical protein